MRRERYICMSDKHFRRDLRSCSAKIQPGDGGTDAHCNGSAYGTCRDTVY